MYLRWAGKWKRKEERGGGGRVGIGKDSGEGARENWLLRPTTGSRLLSGWGLVCDVMDGRAVIRRSSGRVDEGLNER